MSDEPLIAVFVDFENLAIGAREMDIGGFQIQLILKRLLEKGASSTSGPTATGRITPMPCGNFTAKGSRWWTFRRRK